jgi:uncharacterized protein
MKYLRFCTLFYLLFFQLAYAQETSLAVELKPDLTLMIPMRDGTSLPTDLYLPTPNAKGLPCILLRSPSGRQANWKAFAHIAKAGYAVAIQDTRNVLDSEGKTFPFISDGWGKMQDGYDTVEWLANSPYTNGKIGTWGASALGITQLLMAPTHPPHLKCQYIMVAAASLYHHGIFPGGQLLKHQAESWLGYYARDTGVLSYICQRPFYNEFWEQLNTTEVADRVQIPGMHIGGWYDTFLQGTLAAFTARQYHGGPGAKGQQKLVIGPWTHFWPMSIKYGDFEIPKGAENPPIDISPKRWFDYYLKDIDNNVDDLPIVTYYIMGPFDGSESSGNRWQTASQWPIPAIITPFYLTPHKSLQTDFSTEGQLSFVYDPRHPIPTLGGRNLFLESGPKDQQSIEKRPDVLTFTTSPLAEDLEVTGPLTATLFVSSDQKDTDFILRLTDVYPDGKSILISEGAYRLGVMCYESEDKKELRANQPTEILLDLWATSLVFAKGHSIRVSISSSNYPRYEKNLNVGLLGGQSGKFNIAKNSLYMGPQYPSRIILPVVRQEETKPVSPSSPSLPEKAS